MKQWELWKFPYPSADQPHWFVVISPDSICENPSLASVNGLLCNTLRPVGRPLKLWEVKLDEAEGMDPTTIVRCYYIYELNKADAFDHRGVIGTIRRQHISRILRTSFGFG